MDLDLADTHADTRMASAAAADNDSGSAHSEIVALRASVRQLEQIIASHQMHTQRMIEQMRHEWRAAAAAAAASSHHAAAASPSIVPAAGSLSSSPSRRSSLSGSHAPPAPALDPATLSLKDSFSARSRRGSVDPASASSVADATQTIGCPHCTCNHSKVKLTRMQRWSRKFSLCTGCMLLLPLLGVSVCWLIYQSRDHLQFLYRVQRYHDDWRDRVANRPKPIQAAADRLQAMRATREPVATGVVGAIVQHTHIPAAGAGATSTNWAPTSSGARSS